MTSSAVVAHVATPLLGVSTGLRTFTPIAVTAWFAHLGKLRVEGTWAGWVAHPVAVGAFTVAALGEYVGDKLPNTPSRTEPVGLIGRVAMGGLVGAIVATAIKRPVVAGVGMGVLGALAGTYGGYSLRRALVKDAGLADLPVAISEDSAAVALAMRAMRRLTA